MNSKQRVLTAIKCTGLPDRVPLQFDLGRALLDQFGEKHNIPVDYSPSYYEDVTYRISANALRTAMGSDCVVVSGGLPAGYNHPKTADGCIVNEFGMVMRQGLLYMDVVGCPLANVASADEVERFPFPDPYAPGRMDYAKRDIERFGADYFLIGDMELTMFEMAWHMVGLEKFMIDLVSREPHVEALLDKCKEFSIGIGKQLVALGVDAIWAGDDFGAQNGMLISPRLWRSVFKPRFREVFAEMKAVNPDVLICYHCDGARFIYDHTVMQRALGLGYQSDWAQRHLPTRRERNAFYQAAGYKMPPGKSGMAKLSGLDPSLTPPQILAHL